MPEPRTRFDHQSIGLTPAQTIGIGLLFYLGTMATTVILGFWLGIPLVGLETPALVRPPWSGAALSLGILGAVPLLGLGFAGLSLQWKGLIRARTFLEGFMDLFEPMPRLALWSFLLYAAFAEELLFRALLQGALLEPAIGRACAIFVGALVFGLAHPITLTYMVLVVIAGLWLGFLYSATNSLLSVTVAHWITNGVVIEWLLHRRRRFKSGII